MTYKKKKEQKKRKNKKVQAIIGYERGLFCFPCRPARTEPAAARGALSYFARERGKSFGERAQSEQEINTPQRESGLAIPAYYALGVKGGEGEECGCKGKKVVAGKADR